VAPLADKHQMIVAYHGHANVQEPDEVSTPQSFATCLSYSKYHAVNLDIGHFTAAGFDAVAFLREQHARITHLHLKDRRTPAHGAANVAWGEVGSDQNPIGSRPHGEDQRTAALGPGTRLPDLHGHQRCVARPHGDAGRVR
jgi:hypothetical protein